jgi:hypothetical protein
MRPHVSGTERVGFSKQDACGNLVVASLPLTFPFSEFCGRCLLWMSVGLNRIHTFLLHKKSSRWHFLALAKLHSTARVWNHQRISKLVNRVDCCLSSDSFLALCSKAIVRAFLATNASQWDLQHTHAIYGICRLSDDSFLALRLSDSASLPCYECFAAGALLCVK